MKALIHNENIRQPLVLELGGGGVGIPLFDTVSEAEAFLAAVLALEARWEVVEQGALGVAVRKRLWSLSAGLWRGLLATEEFVSEGWMLHDDREQNREMRRRLKKFDTMV